MGRIFQVVIGYLLLTLGISLIIVADIGVGPIESVVIGLNNLFGLTVGTWVWILNVSFIFVISLILWNKPCFKGLFGVFLVGVFVDFWLILVMSDVLLNNLFVKGAVFALGILGVALGVALYLHTKLFVQPWDGLMLALSEKLNISINKAKTLIEFLAMAIGFLLGGGVGLGTVFIVLIIGHVIQWSLKATSRWEYIIP